MKEYIQDTDWHHETRCVHEDAFFKKKLFFTIFDCKVFLESGEQSLGQGSQKNGPMQTVWCKIIGRRTYFTGTKQMDARSQTRAHELDFGDVDRG